VNRADDELVLERWGAVLIMRLNRPAASNALTSSLLRGIGAGAIEAEADPDVRVVVTGTGERVFCAGMDRREDAQECAAVFFEKSAQVWRGR
jgi:enoyl-CoA hydratase/carnithine racemase